MRLLKFKIVLLLVLIYLIISCQPDVQNKIEKVENGLLPAVLIKGDTTWTIQERLTHYKVPGVSIAVIKDFKIDWAKAYGVKDNETKELLTVNTLFQAASISKPVAALAALNKVEAGKISLDQNINEKLTSWKLPENEFTENKKVKLVNLLSHTGGLTVHGFPGYKVGSELPTLSQILDGIPPANTPAVRVDIEPGTKFRYSGGGVTIMQMMLMDIEKRPFPQILKETVLDPVGMTNSTYNQPLPDDVQKMAASGHLADGNVIEGKIHIYPEMAAAGLWTTPTDLSKVAIEVQKSLKGRANKVISQEMTQKMLTPYIADDVGLGFFLSKFEESIYFGHGGANEGFRCRLIAHKDNSYGAAVMVNSNNGAIIGEILRSIAKEYQWDNYLPEPFEIVTVDTQKLDTYPGRYLVNEDRVLTIHSKENRLFVEGTDVLDFDLYPISENKFIRRDRNIQYEFLKNGSGKIDTLMISQGDKNSPAHRISSEIKVPLEYLLEGKFEQALMMYRKMLLDNPKDPIVAENRFNQIGYYLLNQKMYSQAIEIFKLNVKLYPDSWNVYDSLGEGYMLNGDKQLAIKNYKKSLELNPNNTNGIEMLKKLEK